MAENKNLRPLLKYPGGKERELNHINDALPSIINNYYEPFLGGGAVYFNINAKHYYVNDKSKELMDFYKNIASQNNVFFEKLESINDNWKLITDISEKHSEELLQIFYDFYSDNLDERQLSNMLFQFVLHNIKEFNGLLTSDFNVAIEDFINILKRTLLRRYKRMKELSKESGVLKETDIKDNIEASLKASFYTHLRNIQNNSEEFNISNGYSSANAVWVTDITYIYTLSGFVYLTSIMDLYSRAIIGWQLSDSLSTTGVLQAIKKAKANRAPQQPVIIHSDSQ